MFVNEVLSAERVRNTPAFVHHLRRTPPGFVHHLRRTPLASYTTWRSYTTETQRGFGRTMIKGHHPSEQAIA